MKTLSRIFFISLALPMFFMLSFGSSAIDSSQKLVTGVIFTIDSPEYTYQTEQYPNGTVVAYNSEGEPKEALTAKIDTDSTVVPSIIKSRTVIPLRLIVEVFGGDVSWDQNEKKISFKSGEKNVNLWIGRDKYEIDSMEYPLDVPPTIISNRTFVPLRVVSQALGYNVYWDEATRKVEVSKLQYTYETNEYKDVLNSENLMVKSVIEEKVKEFYNKKSWFIGGYNGSTVFNRIHVRFAKSLKFASDNNLLVIVDYNPYERFTIDNKQGIFVFDLKNPSKLLYSNNGPGFNVELLDLNNDGLDEIFLHTVFSYKESYDILKVLHYDNGFRTILEKTLEKFDLHTSDTAYRYKIDTGLHNNFKDIIFEVKSVGSNDSNKVGDIFKYSYNGKEYVITR